MAHLFDELKRRNVLRVAVVYLVLAWLILQVADVVFGFMEVPAWAGRILLAVLLLAFPVVLAFAWVYELTPDGLKRETEVDRGQSITTQTAQRMNVLTAILGGMAILLIAVQAMLPGRPERGEAAAGDVNNTASIAVLPFVNMSSDREQEYFSDGLSEELLNLLAKIPELTVISRTSSFQFKDKPDDVRKIAQALGVGHVLEGSVRKSNNRVRVTAQLISAADGKNLWSQTYERELQDIFSLQDEIAGEVVKALQIELLGAPPATRLVHTETEAYYVFLQARARSRRGTSADIKEAVSLLKQAIALDPGYGLAWSGLALVYFSQVQNGELPIVEGIRMARDAAERAVEVDPNLPEGYVELARIEQAYDWDWAAADQHLRRAQSLDPANYRMLGLKAILALTYGRVDEAKAIYRRLIVLDPLRSSGYHNLALALLRSDSAVAAEAAMLKAIAINPELPKQHYVHAQTLLLQDKNEKALEAILKEKQEVWRISGSALVYHALGRRAEADAALRELEQEHSGSAAFQIAQAYAYRSDSDNAMRWLERAYEQRDGGLSEGPGDPFLRNIDNDPRYHALLRRMNIPT